MVDFANLLEQKRALDHQVAELERQIGEARRAAQAVVIADIKKLMAEHNLTATDIGASLDKSFVKRAKVAPKYINKNTGESWSGRGLMPKWLKMAIEQGQSIENFKI